MLEPVHERGADRIDDERRHEGCREAVAELRVLVCPSAGELVELEREVAQQATDIHAWTIALGPDGALALQRPSDQPVVAERVREATVPQSVSGLRFSASGTSSTTMNRASSIAISATIPFGFVARESSSAPKARL